jgi:hypothetical protein
LIYLGSPINVVAAAKTVSCNVSPILPAKTIGFPPYILDLPVPLFTFSGYTVAVVVLLVLVVPVVVMTPLEDPPDDEFDCVTTGVELEGPTNPRVDDTVPIIVVDAFPPVVRGRPGPTLEKTTSTSLKSM